MPQPSYRRRSSRGGPALVIGLQVVVAGLIAGWFATGHPSAPDDGLQQLDVLSLHEKVPGAEPQGGRPTMVVVTCPSTPVPPRLLDARYGLVISTDPLLADRLALPRATECQAGYVLVDAAGFVRYRTYDTGWARHPQEQEILLENL
jgi:hypothetical protein